MIGILIENKLDSYIALKFLIVDKNKSYVSMFLSPYIAKNSTSKNNYIDKDRQALFHLGLVYMVGGCPG